MSWQKVRLDLPEGLTPAQRQAAAEEMANRMVDNATNGIGVKEKGDNFVRSKFPAYTKKYLDAKGSKNVDLTLSGEMLSSLQVLSVKKDSVLIGFENGTSANDKAEGNILGSYGRSPDPKKARNFLGLVRSEVREIINSIKRE